MSEEGFIAQLIERLASAGVPVVGALLGEESGERALARFGLDDGKAILHALAESLHGRGDMHGPLLLDSVKVRREFDASWRRAREGSREDIAAMVDIGTALLGMKKFKDDANLRTLEDLAGGRLPSDEGGVSVRGWLQDLDRLLPREEATARRYKDNLFLDATIQEMSLDGERPGDVNALTRLYGAPEVVDLLIEARANKKKTGPLSFRRLARALVRPLASRDPAHVKQDRETEDKARDRRKAKTRPRKR